MYEGSCHFSIKMYVPRQDSVRVMYMCMRVGATFLLRCMCQARTVFDSCMCMRVAATFLLRCMCQARTVFGSCVCGLLPLFYYDVCAKPEQCSSQVYVYVGYCYFSIKMHVPRQDSVRVMYMCMRVPATFLLRCICQARTVLGSCICI